MHPFEITFGLGDIRLTSRYSEDELSSLFTAMHETGHGIYEWGVSPTLERTPLCTGASATLHESQSRLWENVVGRSLPFWRWFYPRLQATFPDRLGDVSLESFHRAVNRVRRSFIRVDADETSYGLHVILRFELEQELFSGRLAVADLPEAWNTRFEELMGIPVPNDALGVLQDAHWSGAASGTSRPTSSARCSPSRSGRRRARRSRRRGADRARRVRASCTRGSARTSTRSAASWTPAETIERVVGGPIDPQPYLAYLRDKLALRR